MQAYGATRSTQRIRPSSRKTTGREWGARARACTTNLVPTLAPDDGEAAITRASWRRRWLALTLIVFDALFPAVSTAAAVRPCQPFLTLTGHEYGATVTVHHVRPSTEKTTRAMPPASFAEAETTKLSGTVVFAAGDAMATDGGVVSGAGAGVGVGVGLGVGADTGQAPVVTDAAAGDEIAPVTSTATTENG